MTYEEALSILRFFLGCFVPGRANGKSMLEYTRFEAFCKAIEALEKQIPKNPIFEREQTSPFGVDDVPYCPNCGCDLPEVSYCEKCGQAIDWEVKL